MNYVYATSLALLPVLMRAFFFWCNNFFKLFTAAALEIAAEVAAEAVGAIAKAAPAIGTVSASWEDAPIAGSKTVLRTATDKTRARRNEKNWSKMMKHHNSK